ncbi:hypothetical protein [Pseudonocardia humida]|uniref:Uncharacterized protein n=1 Tax=Pseudonocardia humida TaxID=2800819 RepID=A0ABT0ZXT4_9PSEU|nr:hypothetical protein [Pseudonocardia humida]MCO1655536.1 hypothetical protein [Pseudonocardia humida]
MTVNDRVEIVRFSGGEHDGLVVEAPPHIAARLHAMRFEVLATGRLYDLTDQCRIPGARAVAPPAVPPAAPPAATPPVAVPAAAPLPTAVIPAPTPSPDQQAPAVPALPEALRFADPEPAVQRRAVPPVPTMPVFQPGRSTD